MKVQSYKELEVWKKGVDIVGRRRHISDAELVKLNEHLDHESRMLMNLIKRLRR